MLNFNIILCLSISAVVAIVWVVFLCLENLGE
jgi:hypothetical protein